MKKEDVKLLRKLLLEVDDKSKDTNQMFLRLWDLLDYLEGNKTTEFNNRIKKEYTTLMYKEIEK